MLELLASHSTLLRAAAFAGAFFALLGVKLIRDKTHRRGWDDGSGQARSMRLKDYAPGGALVLIGLVVLVGCLVQPATWKTL